MAKLFISYKRKTTGVIPLIERLEAAHYAVWFDTKDIPTGEPDWQAAIDRGIEWSDAVVLCLTKTACTSKAISYEMEKARKEGKPIFAVLLEEIDDIKACLRELKLPERTQIHRGFLGERLDAWDVAFKDLLADFGKFGVVVTRHGPDWRQVDHEAKERYQNYLKGLRGKIRYIDLKRVISGRKDRIDLGRVYVPLPTTLKLSVEVRDYRIVKWWVGKQFDHRDQVLDTKNVGLGVLNDWKKVETAVLDAIAAQIQHVIDGRIQSRYINEAERPLILAPFWDAPVKEEIWPLTATDIAAISDRLVLIGDPGSGKTTFAKQLALSLLEPQLDSQPERSPDALGQWPHGFLTPVFVRLRDLVESTVFPKLGNPVEIEHFESYLRQLVTSLVSDFETEPIANDIIRDLRAGRALVILDGLDEVPIPVDPEDAIELRRDQLRQLAASLGNYYAESRIIFTTRPYAYKDWMLDDFETVTLAPLTNLQMHQIATNLYRETSIREQGAAEKKADEFLKTLRERDVPQSMYDNPLLLTLMAKLFLDREEEDLPTQKGQLFHESITLLLSSWAEPRIGEDTSLLDRIGCTASELYERLEEIAFRAHSGSTDDADRPARIKRGMLLDELDKLTRRANIRDALDYISDDAGILVDIGDRTYELAHRSFQEYLAASYMARVNPRDFKIVRQMIEEQPQTWRVPSLLVGDILAEKSPNELWVLLDDLLTGQPSEVPKSDSPRWRSVWLAAAIAQEQKLCTDRENIRELYHPVYEHLRESLKALLATHGALPPSERAQAGGILGLMRDDRPGVWIKNDIPDIDWCTIPAGEFQMGTTKEQAEQILKSDWAQGWSFPTREVPNCSPNLPEFQISRYPITIAQFQVFIDADDGYKEPQWWTEAGRAWLEKTGGPVESSWGDTPNLPRTDVSWYEAIAFCNWLSSKLERKIRLPNEAEWEKAARGTDGRLFPWGNNFDPSRCNMNQTNIGSPSPVGCFLLPEGPWKEDSPLDMCGNVWEWSTTICEKEGGKAFPYPYSSTDDERENLKLGEDFLRIVRGGSYLNPAFLVRTAFRGRDKPTIRFARQGFRIVAEIP